MCMESILFEVPEGVSETKHFVLISACVKYMTMNEFFFSFIGNV